MLLRAKSEFNPVVHCLDQLLPADDVALGRLHRSVPEQELDLLDLSPCRMAQPSAAPPQIVWGQFFDPSTFRTVLHHARPRSGSRRAPEHATLPDRSKQLAFADFSRADPTI